MRKGCAGDEHSKGETGGCHFALGAIRNNKKNCVVSTEGASCPFVLAWLDGQCPALPDTGVPLRPVTVRLRIHGEKPQLDPYDMLTTGPRLNGIP